MGKAPSVPKSLLRVKIWYDNGFLQADKIKTHDKAKDYIYATLAHVQHFMCSSTLGTFLETEVCILLDNFNRIHRSYLGGGFYWRLDFNTASRADF